MIFNNLVEVLRVEGLLAGVGGGFGGVLCEEVSGIETDSRKVGSGDVFIAVEGYEEDGHNYIEEAISRGALGVIVQKLEGGWVRGLKSKKREKRKKGKGYWVLVRDTRRALAYISREFYGDPTRGLKLIGVTGTNGKTTVSYMMRECLSLSGELVGVIGTTGYFIGEEEIGGGVTTPCSLELNRMVRKMVGLGVRYLVMEVSSHGLYLERVTGCHFDGVIFTNLTQDHLDFHGSMEEYLKVKLKILDILYRSGKAKKEVLINGDLGAVSDRVTSYARGLGLEYRIYGTSFFKEDPPFFKEDASSVFGYDIKMSLEEGGFCGKFKVRGVEVEVGLGGLFNIQNALGSWGMLEFLGILEGDRLEGLKRVKVAGRLELIRGMGKRVIVDYAHTEDALRNVLEVVKDFCKGKLIVVFGCGGDRDRGKRYLMGRVSGRLADLSILTDDNPRREDSMGILRMIREGVESVGGKWEEISDRRVAIKRGVEICGEEDIVVIAGKGHEEDQIVGIERFHLSDRVEVKKCLGSI